MINCVGNEKNQIQLSFYELYTIIFTLLLIIIIIFINIIWKLKKKPVTKFLFTNNNIT